MSEPRKSSEPPESVRESIEPPSSVTPDSTEEVDSPRSPRYISTTTPTDLEDFVEEIATELDEESAEPE